MELDNKSKKGMIFTLMVIALLSFFIIVYSGYSIIQNRAPTNKRIATLNSLALSTEEDLSRHLFISGYRTIFIMQQYTLDQHLYITDLQSALEEIFYNGTLYGEQKSLMDDGKFSDILISLNNNAEKINANISIENPQITVEQKDPWNILFSLNVTLIIEDNANLAMWNRTSSFEATIPITTFLDPMYHVETSGMVENKILQTPYANFVSGANYTNLTDHFQNSYYKSSTSAPCFLDRIIGNFSANPNGIESIVYPQDLIERELAVQYKSLIDYIYFSASDPQAYEVPAIPNFIIDNQSDHLAIYNVSGVATPI